MKKEISCISKLQATRMPSTVSLDFTALSVAYQGPLISQAKSFPQCMTRNTHCRIIMRGSALYTVNTFWISALLSCNIICTNWSTWKVLSGASKWSLTRWNTVSFYTSLKWGRGKEFWAFGFFPTSCKETSLCPWQRSQSISPDLELGPLSWLYNILTAPRLQSKSTEKRACWRCFW